MKTLLTLLFALPLCAQIPTSGLQIQYDMTTITGGTTLADQSGNANNGTLHGTTPGTPGIAFNGSSDYISIPVIVKNQDFTAIIVATLANASGALWYEGDSGPSNLMRVFAGTGASSLSARILSSNGDSGVFSVTPPTWSFEYHAYYLQRAGGLGTTGMIDRPYRATASIPGTAPNFSGDTCSALGSQIFGASCVSQNVFFQGTMAYFLLYNRALTATELTAAYTGIQTALASRPVFLSDLSPNRLSGPVWNRRGVVIENAQEPMVMYETTNCQIIANPCFKMWASVSTAIAYYESPDGLVWTAHGNVLTAHGGATVVKVGSTYHLYGYSPGGGGLTSTHIDHYTSTDGMAWTSANASVIAPGAANTWDSGYTVNPNVVIDGATWYMTYDGQSTSGTINTGGGNQTGLATSGDGATWTKATANPITGFTFSPIGYTNQGTWLTHTGSKWYMWGTSNGLFAVNGGAGRWEATTPNSLWTKSFLTPGMQPTTEEGYSADLNLLEVNGKTYMYYDTGGTFAAIKLVVANMPLSQLVLTSEGAFSSVP